MIRVNERLNNAMLFGHQCDQWPKVEDKKVVDGDHIVIGIEECQNHCVSE